jgi:hypothetical protein
MIFVSKMRDDRAKLQENRMPHGFAALWGLGKPAPIVGAGNPQS